jgi:hypothetical protein
MTEPLAKWAKPAVDDARLARQWSAISKTKPVARAPIVFAFAATVVVTAFVTWQLTHRPPLPPMVVQAGVAELLSTEAPSTLVLADGSRITATPRSHLSIEPSYGSMRIVLVSGGADFDVRHDPSRKFVVVARGVTVVDTGTRFHVEYTERDGDVRVTVLEGSVRVERAESAPSSLIAGDSWTSASAHVEPTEVAPPLIGSADASHVASPVQPDAFERFAAIAERDPNGAFDVFGEAGYPRAITRATPKQLFELGDAARLSGHPVQAADAFDALRTKHPTDARAGLAAMQLARVREETLHDPAGAESALRDAIALAPDATLREDAEARRVGVLQAMNERAACIVARDAYLAKYPQGIHRSSVEKRCK